MVSLPLPEDSEYCVVQDAIRENGRQNLNYFAKRSCRLKERREALVPYFRNSMKPHNAKLVNEIL